MKRYVTLAVNALFGAVLYLAPGPLYADTPFATRVMDYSPAPGQFVNSAMFNDPAEALGPPSGAGSGAAGNASIVSLGGFAGSLVLGFDHTVMDDPLNPLGLDAIVYGNAFWVGGHPNRHWAECGVLEISRDENGNGLADDPWRLIPGSHITDAVAQFTVQTWDDDTADPTYPPASSAWIPPGHGGVWTTSGFLLPASVFNAPTIANPNGLSATVEGIFGYADYAPTAVLGDTDGDNLPDDPSATPEAFYTVPDDPFEVGVTPGSGGGDAFDIAWAIDPLTGEPAGLDGFDFLRITTGVNYVGIFGEISPEIDAAADVRPNRLGDADGDGDVDLADFAAFDGCLAAPDAGIAGPCRFMDFDADGDVDLVDVGPFLNGYGT